MGGSVSRGNDNQDLIDKLKEAKLVRTSSVERVLRLVDRGNYFLPNYRTQAYVDSAWREGKLHLSAPCIYCEVLERLDLEPGYSFLNIGSGTGYLNTLVGLLIGSQGVNHGIEYHDSNVAYAEQCLTEFITTSDAVFERAFTPPQFTCGNIFRLAENGQRARFYDRIYCGARVDECVPLEMIKSMLSTGGILVAPVNDKLKKITRVSMNEYTSEDVMTVAFASLLEPTSSEPYVAHMPPPPEITSLQTLCVRLVQQLFRERIERAKGKLPDLKRIRYSTQRNPEENEEDTPAEESPPRRIRVCPGRLSRPEFPSSSDDDNVEKREREGEAPKEEEGMEVELGGGGEGGSAPTSTGGLRLDSESSGLGTSVDTGTGSGLERNGRGKAEDSGADSGTDDDDEMMMTTMLPLLQRVYHPHPPQLGGDIHGVDEDGSRDQDRDLAAAREFRARLMHISRSNSPFYDSEGEEGGGGGQVVPNVLEEQEFLFREEMALLSASLPLPASLRNMLAAPACLAYI